MKHYLVGILGGLIVCLLAGVCGCEAKNDALIEAVETGNRAEVIRLFEEGADPHWTDRDRQTLLNYALYARQFEMMKVLADYGVDPTIKDRKGFSVIDALKSWLNRTDKRMEEHRKYLIEKEGVTEEDARKRIEASRVPGGGLNEEDAKKVEEVLNYLQKLAPSFTVRTPRSTPTPEPARVLFHALLEGRHDDVLRLLEGGADPNWQDSQGYTLLMYAVAAGQYDLIERLIEYGADPNVTDRHGFTVIDMLMVLQGDNLKETMNALKQRGVNEFALKQMIRVSTEPKRITDAERQKMKEVLRDLKHLKKEKNRP